jgi:hypothetical protein
LHHYVLHKDDPMAALNILRVIADGRCEQLDDKAAAHNGLPTSGAGGYWQAGIHELQLAPSMTRRWG